MSLYKGLPALLDTGKVLNTRNCLAVFPTPSVCVAYSKGSVNTVHPKHESTAEQKLILTDRRANGIKTRTINFDYSFNEVYGGRETEYREEKRRVSRGS